MALGAVIDGCPAGVVWNQSLLQLSLDRRRPGQNDLTSARGEADQCEILSGVHENVTLGTPIAAIVRNVDARPQDYSPERVEARRGHASDLWAEKFGHADPRGSGRASGRETLSRVIGGAVARMFVTQLYPEAQVVAFTSRIGLIGLSVEDCTDAAEALEGDPWHCDEFKTRCPSSEKNELMENLLREAKQTGESYGGMAFVRLNGLPRGLGQPVFNKLKADLVAAMMGVGATAGVEIGRGFESASASGREYHSDRQDYGGLRGGISTGDPIDLNVAFKPASTRGKMATEGRHDPCIVPRAVPVLEAMAWLVLADQILQARLDRV